MSASADENFTFERLAGTDRYGTAADIATESFTTAGTVVLASGGARNFPDALAGNYLAGALNAPILLTPNNSLAPVTRSALEQLDAENVVIVGGTAAVSSGVESALETAGYTVTREAGVDRYQTAKEIAESQPATGIGSLENKGRTAILASGEEFADALTAGPLSFDRRVPVLLTGSNGLNSATAASLDTLGIDHVVVVGGTARITNATQTAVQENGERTTTRLAGTTRQLTAVAIANYAKTNAGFVDTHVDLATGLVFADALAGGPHSGRLRAPILLTESASSLGAAARDYLRANCGTLLEGHVFGGTVAVSDAAATEGNLAARCAAPPPPPSPSPSATPTATVSPSPTATAGPTTNQSFTVTPAERAVNTFSTSTGANSNRGARTYSASTGSAGAVDIALIPAANVRRAANGTITFLDETGASNRADNLGETLAVIETVNGVPVNGGDYIDTVAPANGTITFTIDSTESNIEVVPVIFGDADNNNQLNLAATDQPSESFGVGGAKLFVPVEGVFQTYNNEQVVLTEKGLDFFTTADELFNYDSTDAFQYSSGVGPQITITLAQFEEWVSAGDFVNVNYNPGGSSTFLITDDRPAAPTNVTATVTNTDFGDTDGDSLNDDVRVSWTAPTNPDVAAYDVFRSEINETTGAVVNSDYLGRVDGKTNTTFNDRDVLSQAQSTSNTFVYVVRAVNQESGTQSPASAPARVVVPDTISAATPFSVFTEFANGPVAADDLVQAGLERVDSGDVLEITFDNEPITVASNAFFTLRDADGNLMRITNGVNATFSVNSAGTVLTVTMTGNPTQVESNGGDATLNADGEPGETGDPANFWVVETAGGITNSAGNWNLAQSGIDDADFTRVFETVTNGEEGGNGDNSDLPQEVDSNDVRVNPNADQITVDADADDNGSDIQNGDPFFLYNAAGQQIATGTYNSGTDTTVNVTGGFTFGDTLYFNYRDLSATNGEFSATTVVFNPTDVPSVTEVDQTAEGDLDTITVYFQDNDLPDTTNPQTGITQVGPASNYTVYNAANNELVATGVSTQPGTGSGTGGTCGSEYPGCPIIVNLNAELETGETYVLRVAANTVQDPNNQPNVAEVETFEFIYFDEFDIEAGFFFTGSPDEGETAPLGVRLTRQPTGTVTVQVTSNNGEATVAPTTLTFTPANFDDTQFVDVTVAEDADATNDGYTITLSTVDGSTTTEYDSADASVSWTAVDNDTAGPTFTTSSPEAGVDNVVLFNSSAPIDPATVDATDFTVVGGETVTAVSLIDADTIEVTLDGALEDGDTVTLPADSVTDTNGQGNQAATATADDSTAPDLTSVSGAQGSNVVTLTYNEAVFGAATPDDFTVTQGATTYLVSAENLPNTGPGATSFTITLASPLAAATDITVTTQLEANDITDADGNSAVSDTQTGTVTAAP